MLQPFEPFKKICIDKLLSMGRKYLVSQTYSRGVDHFADAQRIGILFTDYDEKGMTQMHFNAVKADKYASIIDLTNEAHKAKVVEMLEGKKYSLYWNVVRSVAALEKRLEAGYKDKIKKYIQTRTDWRIGGDETLRTNLEITYGEIFITLKWRTKKIKIKFEEIERL